MYSSVGEERVDLMQWYGVEGILFSFLARSLASHDSCAFVIFIMQGENPTARLTIKECRKPTSQIQIIKKVIREPHIGHSNKNFIDGLLHCYTGLLIVLLPLILLGLQLLPTPPPQRPTLKQR
jgi:hypothetical protein